MDDAMCSLKIKLIFLLPPPHHPSKRNNVEVRLDHFCPRLNNNDQAGVGEGGTTSAGRASCR